MVHMKQDPTCRHHRPEALARLLLLFITASSLGMVLPTTARGDVKEVEAKQRAEEERLAREYRQKLVASKRAFVQELERSRGAAMKAGNLKDANAADEAVRRTKAEMESG